MHRDLLIVYNITHHYRIPIFNLLAEHYNLTVLHSGKTEYFSLDKKINFNEIIIKQYDFGPFSLRPSVIKHMIKFNNIIILSDVRYLFEMIFLLLNYKKKKIILWGNWFTKSWIANKFRILISKLSFSNIFYSKVTMKEFINSGVDSSKCFTANNTIYVDRNLVKKSTNKNKILLVGSLNKRKKIDVIIKTFIEISDKIPNVSLEIIGSGSEFNRLKKLTGSKKNKINFHGKITDKNKLSEYYKDAICEVSYSQAGLSILQSLGYGVPFITSAKSISGGEIYNIVNGYNGFLIDNENQLKDILLNLCKNKSLIRELSKNALEYYDNFCTINHMLNGFLSALSTKK